MGMSSTPLFRLATAGEGRKGKILTERTVIDCDFRSRFVDGRRGRRKKFSRRKKKREETGSTRSRATGELEGGGEKRKKNCSSVCRFKASNAPL